jgi:hypothetical protein
MAIIHQYDKRSDLTYAYESHSYWDKEKKMSRAKRTLIGRVDKETGEIIPTDGRGRKSKEKGVADNDPDYKALYEKLFKKCESQKMLIAALKEELHRQEKR